MTIKEIIILIVVCTLFGTLIKCGGSTTKQVEDVEYQLERSKDSTLIATQQIQLFEQKQLNDLLSIENQNLRNFKGQVKWKTKTLIKEVYIPYTTTDTIYCEITDTIIKYPIKTFRVDNEWYGVNGRVLDKGIELDSIYFTNKYKLVIADKKKQTVVQLTSDNPYASIDNMNNLFVINKKKPLINPKVAFIGGLLVGAIIIKK